VALYLGVIRRTTRLGAQQTQIHLRQYRFLFSIVTALKDIKILGLERATEAANGRDVRLGGGVATIQQYLRAGLVDELHLAIAPVLLGSGERLFGDLDALKLGYRCIRHVPAPSVMHVVLARST